MSSIIYANKPKDFSLWDSHRDVLKDLFLTQKRPLRKVKELMESEHGFPRSLTLSIYETTLRDHFGFRKNLKREDWEAIATHVGKRQKLQGKGSEVAFLGDPITNEKVVKEIRRYCPETIDGNIPTSAATPPLPTNVIIRTPPPTLLETALDPQSLRNNVVHAPRVEDTGTEMDSITSFCRDITQSFASLPPDIRHETGYLLGGRFSWARMNLPINQFAGEIIKTLDKARRHRGNITEDMLRSLADLHQMTGSPKVFGLNTSVAVLVNASYMLSNRYLEWDQSGPFLDWVEKVADMQLLRQFFSQSTPTAVSSWQSLIDTEGERKGSFDMLAAIWFEIGLTVSEGRWIKDNADLCAEVLDFMSPTRGWKTWKHMSHALSKLFGCQWPEYESQVLKSLVPRSMKDPVFTKDLIDSSESLPQTIDLSYQIPSDIVGYNMDCIQMLVEAGVSFDLESTGLYKEFFRFLPSYTPGETLESVWFAELGLVVKFVDFCTGLPKECITVFGICAAASRGLEFLREYLQGKRHSVPLTDACEVSPTEKELLQTALTEMVGMGFRRIVEVLLHHGVDVEGKDLGTRHRYKPAVKAVQAADSDMIALLANHGADFDGQDISDALIQYKRIESDDVSQAENCETLIDLLVDVGLSLQAHGPATMLRAVGIFNYKNPLDDVLIKALKKRGVTWDESFFEYGEHWGYSGKRFGGVDLLHTAVRKACRINTIQRLLDDGIQMHSRPCELDGKSILQAALTSKHPERNAVIRTLLGYMGTEREGDPAWPEILELSVMEYFNDFESELELFHYVKGLGATLPLAANPVRAKRRFALLPILLAANARDRTVREVWNHGEGFEKLHDKDRDRLLLETINAGAFSWVCTLIEHGANVNGEVDFDYNSGTTDGGITPIQSACMAGSCSSQVFRYLLEHGGNTTFAGKSGLTAMHYAAYHGQLNLAGLILENHADVDAVWTPDSSQTNDLALRNLTVINYLRGTVHERWLQTMFTPLDVAAARGRLDMVKFLLNMGARSAFPGLTGFDGALKLAQQQKHPGVVMLFNETIGSTL